jgi:hypothetical protein
MKTRCGARTPRRYRRPVPLPASRSQIRQKVDQLRVLYQLEAVMELSRPEPDLDHLVRIDTDAGLLNELLASLEEQI